MPVLIVGTYDENGSPDAMNAAWGGIHDTNQIGVCIDPSHKTAKNLLAKKAFTVSIGDAAHVVECDFVGLVSGIYQGKCAVSAIAMVGKRPETSGKGLALTVMVETYALLALLISFLALMFITQSITG